MLNKKNKTKTLSFLLLLFSSFCCSAEGVFLDPSLLPSDAHSIVNAMKIIKKSDHTGSFSPVNLLSSNVNFIKSNNNFIVYNKNDRVNEVEPELFSQLLNPFFVWNPHNISGFVIVKNKEKVKYPTKKNPAVLVYKGSYIKRKISKPAYDRFLAATLIGNAIFLKQNDSNKFAISYCSTIFEKYSCDTKKDDYYEISAWFLAKFTKECAACTKNDISFLRYVLCEYLMRTQQSNMKLKNYAYSLLMSNKKNFETLGLDVLHLEDIYRQSLTDY